MEQAKASVAAAGDAAMLARAVRDHSAQYAAMPWVPVASPAERWAAQPTFVVGEACFIAMAACGLLHALSAAPRRRLPLLWLGTFVVGTANDYIFMLLPVVDNFWHAQAVVMLSPRLPLYIVCIYNAFMYWSAVAAARVFHHTHRPSPLAEAGLAGLLGGVLYAPYDIVGARFLWWTWHDSDPGVVERWLGVPHGSTGYIFWFGAIYCRLMRAAAARGWGPARSLALACLTTPVMMVAISVAGGVAGEQGGMPGGGCVLVTAALLAAPVLYRAACPAAVAPADTAAAPLSRPEPAAVRAFVGPGYFLLFLLLIAAGRTEQHTSTGVHQAFGPCNETDVDMMGLPRVKYVCRDQYPRSYYTFDCPGGVPPEDAVQADGLARWYTICGYRRDDQQTRVAAVAALGAAGAAAYVWAYSRTAPADRGASLKAQ